MAATTSTTLSIPSTLTSTTHPTPSYRIAMTSGAGTVDTSTTTSTVPIRPAIRSPSISVVDSLPQGLLGPPVQRSTRLSLPPKLDQSSQLAKRSSLPPPPPSPALRKKAALVFYAIVAQFFLSIGCLFWAIAATITLFSFGLECSFNVGSSGILALVTFSFLIVVGQLIISALGIAAFNGKQQVETKIYLLITYLSINLLIIFIDAGLLFVCVAGSVLSFMFDRDCSNELRIDEYITLGSFFVFFGFTLLLHLIISAGISVLLCLTNELFVQRSSPTSTTITTTTTTIKEEQLSAPAPPIKRFSQV